MTLRENDFLWNVWNTLTIGETSKEPIQHPGYSRHKPRKHTPNNLVPVAIVGCHLAPHYQPRNWIIKISKNQDILMNSLSDINSTFISVWYSDNSILLCSLGDSGQ